jgi:hypothetical protein
MPVPTDMRYHVAEAAVVSAVSAIKPKGVHHVQERGADAGSNEELPQSDLAHMCNQPSRTFWLAPVPVANLVRLASGGEMGDATVQCGTFAD